MLEVAMQTTIKTLFKKGMNKSEISRTLGVDRKTVRKVLNTPEDSVIEKKPHPSILDEYKEYIENKLSHDLNATRIYQDIRADFDYDGCYSTVRDYVRKLKGSSQNVFMVLESKPGEEAQVDFGYIGTIKIDNKYRKAWVFVMVLSYSRYLYSEIVFDQSVKTFVAAHVNAFKYFGGVPQTVKIDNLKAAVLQADFYEPLVQRTYSAFSAHYGFLPEPCRVYTPTDKGKVESGVKYVKENCFKGRNFKDYDTAKKFLLNWLDTVANSRKHGTTKKIPKEEFSTYEKVMLISLPTEEFVFSVSQKAKINTNCHFSYSGTYYSAPFQYVGYVVDVIEVNNLLKIYYEGAELAIHTKSNDKGSYVTNPLHYPKSKTITFEEIKENQRIAMESIGTDALRFYETFMSNENSGKRDYRALSGIIALKKKYDTDLINGACKRALVYGSTKYTLVKAICEKGIIGLPDYKNETFISDMPNIVARNLNEYSDLCNMGVIDNE